MMVEIIGNLICSVFFTYLITFTADITKVQMFFIFMYFVLMNGILYLIFRYKKKKFLKKESWKSKVFILGFSIIATIFICPNFYPRQYQDVIISTSSEKNVESKGTEVWISGIRVNDRSVKLNTLDVTSPWTYIDDSNVIFVNAGNSADNNWVIPLPDGEKATIVFGTHAWSGMVEILCGNSVVVQDLFSEESGQKMVDIYRAYSEASIPIRIAICVGGIVAFCRVFCFLTVFWKKRENHIII